jgi:hypothetical protein
LPEMEMGKGKERAMKQAPCHERRKEGIRKGVF